MVQCMIGTEVVVSRMSGKPNAAVVSRRIYTNKLEMNVNDSEQPKKQAKTSNECGETPREEKSTRRKVEGREPRRDPFKISCPGVMQ